MKSWNDITDDILVDPDYKLPDGFLTPEEEAELEAKFDKLFVSKKIAKSQPGPTDVHQSVGMFDAKKPKKRKKIGKSFEEIYKARAKSGYGPGKNPNSHSRG
jgi:hypothetical protein